MVKSSKDSLRGGALDSAYLIRYALSVKIEKTGAFDKWLRRLRDERARVRIALRLDRVAETGNLGDYKSVGGGVFEFGSITGRAIGFISRGVARLW